MKTWLKRTLIVTVSLSVIVAIAVIGCSESRHLGRRSSMRMNALYSAKEYPFQPSAEWNREAYAHIDENEFRRVADHPLSTFSIDVDTASYANVRRLIGDGYKPPAGAIRVEEMINYFNYAYAPPPADTAAPFAVHAAVAGCPCNDAHRLARIALKGKEIHRDERVNSNLVFLLDVSGSMNSRDKLGLVKRSMKMLVKNLSKRDRVAIVVYAGAAGRVLDSTPGDQKRKITKALDRLSAGGSTHGAAGIRLAYRTARDNFIEDGVNRVIICTDGDFNVGVTSESELVKLIRQSAKDGVFLSVLGFGTGNYQDSRMELLADKGNGNYAYIDTIGEARKVLVEQMSGTLVAIAKDVKIQVEFNPAKVGAYRLIGYENRLLNKEDFNDDAKDAGEIGAGHTVTALYEIIPPGAGTVDPLKYQKPAGGEGVAASDEMFTVKVRYKQPDGDESKLIVHAVTDEGDSIAKADSDFRFAAAVASFGMILRDSKYSGGFTLNDAIRLARKARGKDDGGYRSEMIKLMKDARSLPEEAMSMR